MRRRRLIFCIFLLSSACHVHAQVSMTLQVPPAGVLLKNQLWNMILVNSGNTDMLLRVNLVLLNTKNNQPVLTGVSTPFRLPRGAKQLQSGDVNPVQYSYSVPISSSDADPNGLLPAGSYQACYSILSVDKNGATMAENCILVAVDPLSPPLLNAPADEAKVATPYPQFTWLPPTPLGIFNDLSYDMILVEVLAGQDKTDAIQQNIPVYTSGNIRNLYLNYASSYRALDTSKLYAWRVVALNSGQAVAMTDIWTFRIHSPELSPVTIKEEPYIKIGRGMDASVASVGKTLRLFYNNEAADTAIQYSIISLEEAGNPVVQEDKITVKYGENRLQLAINRQNRYLKGKIYMLSFTNGRNETWSVKFLSNQ